MAILVSMVLSTALLTGVSSLVYSGRVSDLQNSKEINGDWNYAIPADQNTVEEIAKTKSVKYKVEKYGICKFIENVEDNNSIAVLYGDSSYLDMTNQPVIEGNYPKEDDEIAMSEFVLANIGVRSEIGSKVRVGEKQYVLSGILSDPWASDSNSMSVFVNETSLNNSTTAFIYIKFDETAQMYKQRDALQKELGLDSDDILENDNVNYYLGGESPQSFFEHIKFAFTNSDGNFTYLMLVLRDEFGLTVNGVIIGLGLFSLFIIYSIFNVTISKRFSQYGILNILGIGRKNQFFLVLTELWCLLLVGFPLGAVLGNLGAKGLYSKFNTVFLDKGVAETGNHMSETESFLAAAKLSVQKFNISWKAILFEILFLFIAMVFIAWRMQKKTEEMTVVQMVKMERKKARKSRVIYSKKVRSMPNTLNQRFMLERKKNFFYNIDIIIFRRSYIPVFELYY
jgi:ABC-type antimicrobial peptide transport system permease subunit